MGEREISHCRDLHPTSHVQLVRLHNKVVLGTLAGSFSFALGTIEGSIRAVSRLDNMQGG